MLRLATGATAGLFLLATTGCPGDDGGDDTNAGSSSSGEPTDTSADDDPSVTVTMSASESSTESSSSGVVADSSSSGDSGTTESSSGGSESSDSSGSESSTGTADELPDIDMLAVATEIQESAYTMTRNFGDNDCALEEMCVDAAGARRLLRFDTITPNVGNADFIVGNPDDNPENFEFGACHGHFHFISFANYRLLAEDGTVAATGHKQSFALIDLAQFLPDAGPGQYPLPDGTQGISMGWADIYDSVLDCQWIDITDVAPGDYQLEIEINFDQLIVESDYTNNIITVDVTIDDSDPPPPMVPDEWTCDPSWYETDDGCDCGCGALDPDCPNPTVDACEYCGYEGSCNEGDMDCSEIQMNNNALCE